MEKKQELVTHSAGETEEAGQRFGKNLKAGDIGLLTGELGAGKTTFVLGVSKALEVKSRVISPTFVLVRKHKGKVGDRKINLYHIDLYRLEDTREIKNIGLDDIFSDESGIFLIEWGEKHENLKANWGISFEVLNNDERKITIENHASTPGL